MKKHLGRAKIWVIVLLMLAPIILSPIQVFAEGAPVVSNDEDVKRAMYAFAAYQCAADVQKESLVGNTWGTLLKSPDTKTNMGNRSSRAIGETVSCADAFANIAGGRLTAEMTGEGQILNPIYTTDITFGPTMSCTYHLGDNPDTFYWPQGWIYDSGGSGGNGSYKNRTGRKYDKDVGNIIEVPRFVIIYNSSSLDGNTGEEWQDGAFGLMGWGGKSISEKWFNLNDEQDGIYAKLNAIPEGYWQNAPNDQEVADELCKEIVLNTVPHMTQSWRQDNPKTWTSLGLFSSDENHHTGVARSDEALPVDIDSISAIRSNGEELIERLIFGVRYEASTTPQQLRSNISRLYLNDATTVVDWCNMFGGQTDEERRNIIQQQYGGAPLLAKVCLADQQTGEQEESACSKAAGTLGWIMCSAIQIVGDGVTGLYGWIERQLEVPPTLLETDNAVYNAWSDFRNYANIAFAIVLVIVILAQLTGIGISNYNIKKILPRLIAVVILVNLSYIICQLAVDLSNVLGYSLKSLFQNLAQSINEIYPDDGNLTPYTAGSLAKDILVGLGLVGGAASIILVGSGIVNWLIPILIGFLGVLISVFFFFLIIGVRKAGVILLVVVAPLAIICYALPNTKFIFDRWKKLFTAMLLVFPICGALMGGGEFASAVLLNAGAQGEQTEFYYVLVAMLLNVVPFFLIPSILKSSMAAAGNLGAKIASFGQRARGGITGGIKNSEAVKNRQRGIANWANERRANHYNRKLSKKEAKGKQLKGWQQRRYARATSANMKYRTEQAMAEATSGGAIGKDSEEYKNMVARLKGKDRDEATAAQEAAYRAGDYGAYDGSGTINANDDKIGGSLYKEGEALLRDLNSGTLSGADKDRAQTRLRAVANMLSATGDGRRALARLMQKDLTDNDHTNGVESGLSYLGSHLVNSGIAAKYKRSNRDLFDLSNNLSDKKYIFDSSSSNNATNGVSGRMTDADYTKRYRLAGSSSLTAQDLAGMDENDLDEIYAALGSADATTIKNFRNLANGVMSNPTVFGNLQPKVQERISRIASFGYSNGARSAGVSDLNNNTHTIGSRALAREAGAATLSALSNNIAELASSGRLTVGGTNFDSDAYQEIQDLTENARRALMSGDALDANVANGLQEVIASAQNAGVVDYNGNAFAPVDSTRITIRGGKQFTDNEKAAAMEQQYRSGSIQATGGGQLDTNNIAALQAEQQALLSQLAAAPTDQEVQIRLGAVQNMMAAQGPAGIDAITDTFAKQLGGGTQLSANQQSALQYATQQITNGQYSSQVSDADPILSQMMSDISGGTFNVRNSAAKVKYDYNNATAQLLNPDRIMNMSDAARSNLIRNVKNAPQGAVTATARAANNALSESYGANLSQQQIRQAQTVFAHSFGAGSPHVGGSVTTGANAFVQNGPTSVQNAINWLRSASLSSSADRELARNVVENARIAARQYGSQLSGDMNNAINDLRKTAKLRGLKDSAGGDFY